jgi:hypothetical protein
LIDARCTGRRAPIRQLNQMVALSASRRWMTPGPQPGGDAAAVSFTGIIRRITDPRVTGTVAARNA